LDEEGEVGRSVVDEAADGDAKLAKRRLALLETSRFLRSVADVHDLASRWLSAGSAPDQLMEA
jgi:hypothetical protein